MQKRRKWLNAPLFFRGGAKTTAGQSGAVVQILGAFFGGFFSWRRIVQAVAAALYFTMSSQPRWGSTIKESVGLMVRASWKSLMAGAVRVHLAGSRARDLKSIWS